MRLKDKENILGYSPPRLATENDLDAINALIDDTDLLRSGPRDEMTEDDIERWKDREFTRPFVVETNGGEIAGHASGHVVQTSYRKKWINIEGVVVAKEHRGAPGYLAMKLLSALVNDARELGCSKIVGISEPNRRSRKVWLRYGFKPEKDSPAHLVLWITGSRKKQDVS